jgi:hypothetical protein
MCASEFQAPNDPGRRESEEESEGRNMMELIQELRVASIGTQVLFGFLLSLHFSGRFVKLGANQRHLYLATLLLAALGIGLLSSPVAHHRAVFRQHKNRACFTSRVRWRSLVSRSSDLQFHWRCCWQPDLSFTALPSLWSLPRLQVCPFSVDC